MTEKRDQKKTVTNAFKLAGVGPQIAHYLARLNIFSIEELLFYLPFRYQDRTIVYSIRQLIPGTHAVIEGIITSVSAGKKRTKLLCQLSDDTGKIYLRFFHVLTFQTKILTLGTRLRCYSEVRLGAKGLEMIHPEIHVITQNKHIPIENHLTPIYGATQGLSQYVLRKLTNNALTWLKQAEAMPELIPADLLQSLDLPSLKEALQVVHRPPSSICIEDLVAKKTNAQKRIIFEELLAHRMSLLRLKKTFQEQRGIALPSKGILGQRFVKHLSFKLTEAQKRVIAEISKDLANPFPMLRLIQGDVGSGKTVIAAFAMLQAVEHQYQAAIMAPTELLAEQHFNLFKNWFEPLGIKVVLFSSNIKTEARAFAIKAIENGEAQIIIGTHALFQASVHFAKLALVIVDEQHRFGVHQRSLFREKGIQANNYPHQLMMTATPIPRTLAMSFYADLDCSMLDELPPGRTPVITSVIADDKREEVINRIHLACQQGRQAYWVCPLIDESENISCQAVNNTFKALQKALPTLTLGLIHGRMKSEDKELNMRAFQQRKIDLLVATSVIEVGVDIPNASVMVIENSERMGLAQLHQLRGRVGRSNIVSHCILLYQKPLSPIAIQRLSVMRETNDGFKIAERDLELRGPGEVLGIKQTGELTFRVADLLRDYDLLVKIQQAADYIWTNETGLIEPLIKRWLDNNAQIYGKV